MRPKTIDDVLLAYEMAVRELHSKYDKLATLTAATARAESEIRAQNTLVSQLREDVARYTREAA